MLRKLATEECSIRRASVANGERDPADAAQILADLACTPFSAADTGRLGALQQNGLIQSISEVYETVIIGLYDIRVNDVAMHEGVDYLVVATASWPTVAAMHVTMERVLQ